MRVIKLAQFYEEMKAQGVKRIEDVAFACPRCRTIQSAADLMMAGAGDSVEEVEKYLGFACIGRFTGERIGCNWTLGGSGGLCSLHELEVVTDDGKHHPHFDLATPEQAQSHAESKLN